DADSDSDSGAETGASTDMSGKVGGQGPDATGSAKGGLCTAHFARGATTSEHAGGVAEDNLQAAATAAGQSVDEFCASAVHETSSSESESTPDQADDGAPSNNGGEKSQKPTDPGPPSDDPGASGDPNKAKKAKSPSTPGASGGS
ncbi:MAG: hypothetical protein QOD38_512, partial [Acidimicrobiaceae bacterium]